MKRILLIITLVFLVAGNAWSWSDNEYPNEDKAKVDLISVSQPVDLDDMESDIADNAAAIPDVSDTAYDATSWDNNTDAASKNAIRDKLESIGAGHAAVTLDASATTGGLSIIGQAISFRAATTDQTGYLTDTDWDTFNNKLSAEVDGSTSNEINTVTGDNTATTSGLAITIAGAGLATTAVAGDTLTITATGDGTGTDDQTATEVSVSTTNFGGIFANDSTSDTVQEALDLADDHNHSGIYEPADADLTTLANYGFGTGANQAVQLAAVPGVPDGSKFLRDDMTFAAPPGNSTGYISLSAAGMWPSTTNGCSVNALTESTTYLHNHYNLAFDASTIEYAECSFPAPKDWDGGSMTAEFYWTHNTTTTNFGVVWAIQGIAYADGDVVDASWGTAQVIADTGGDETKIYISGSTPAFTVSGSPAGGQKIGIRVYRYVTDGSDTLEVDSKLEDVLITYTK